MRTSAVVRAVLGIAAVVVLALAAYGTLAFAEETRQLGGAALGGGYVQDDHYYVADHGRYTEVTAEQWELNRAHGVRMFVMQPFALLAMGFLVVGFVVPSFVGSASPEAAERVRKLASSGPLLGSARCRARIGIANLPVRVTVYPGGVIVHPLWLRERPIPSPEITAVRRREGPLSTSIEIEHRSADLRSPVLLRLDPSTPTATALLRFSPGGST